MRPMPAKTLRVIAFSVLGLVLAGLLVLSWLVLTFEPNDYRETLISEVETRTGRAFAINGGIDLHLDPPQVGFEIRDVSFDNPPGFDQEPMLSAKRVEVYLRLLPLLFGELRLHSIRLDDAQLQLRRKSNGHTNWASLLAEDDQDDSAATEPDDSAPELRLGAIHLSNSTIAVWDEVRNRRVRGTQLNLQLNDLTADGHMHVQLDAELMGWPDTRANSRINAMVQLSTDLELSADGSRIGGEDLDIRLELSSPAFAFTSLSPNLRADAFQWDRATDSLEALEVEAAAEGARLRLERLEVQSLTKQPELTGHVEGTDIDIMRWLDLWNVEIPAPADPTALRFLEGEGDIRIHPRGLRLTGLEATLDSTRIHGEVSLLDFEQPYLALDLDLSELDLDRYFPQDLELEDRAPAPNAGPSPAEDDGLPTDRLLQQKLAIKLQADRLRWQGLNFADTQLQMSADRGRWEISSLTGRLNDGAVEAGAEMDLSAGIPTYQLDLKLQQLELGRLLGLFQEEENIPVEGVTDLDLTLKARGRQLDTSWSSLTGFVHLTVRNGILQVGGIVRAVESVLAVLQGRPSETTSRGKLPFDLLLASWNVNDGRFTSRDLKMLAGAIALDGQGYIDLPNSMLNYQLNVASGDHLKIPVRITGPFGDLSHSMDMSSLIEEQLSQGLDKGLESIKREIKEKTDKKQGKALRKFLNDLF